jgi:hypothetical protein
MMPFLTHPTKWRISSRHPHSRLSALFPYSPSGDQREFPRLFPHYGRRLDGNRSSFYGQSIQYHPVGYRFRVKVIFTRLE